MKPLYNSTNGQQRTNQRRRIGDMPKHLIQELKGMDTHTATRIKIAASMSVAAIVYATNF